MPRAEKSLRQHISDNGGKLNLTDAITVLKDIAEGLASLESSVVHRDLKPENVLYLNGKWCLADFGIARYAEATTAADTHKYSFTPPYAAPEQWRSDRATPATDIYALGVVGYEILSGKRPFSGPSEHNYREQHLHDDPPRLSGIPNIIEAMLVECLYKPAQSRPSAANLLTRLQKVQEPVKEAFNPLLAANLHAAHKAAEQARQISIQQSENERRKTLSSIAQKSLSRICDELRSQIEQNAPQAKYNANRKMWFYKLNDATLVVHPAQDLDLHTLQKHKYSFDIIAYGEIAVHIPQDQHGYSGRSHSLWYCDAQEEGLYRWYEMAFCWLLGGRSSVNPFALPPGEESSLALGSVIHSTNLSRPFVPIDQGNEEEFINRWIKVFGEAALGKIQMPMTSPEINPQGSWRKK